MELTEDQYQNQFRSDKREKALERAWKNRDFEIELYWKRATYFWAFTAATFTGYFVVLSHVEEIKYKYLEILIAIMGFIFSLSWYLVNLGSKKWQENWEKHIDMLEDEVTGPLYKTVLLKKAPSVSDVNMQVSLFVTVVWIYLVARFFFPIEDIFYTVNLASSILIIVLLFFTFSITGLFKWILKKVLKKDSSFKFETRKPNYSKK